MKALTLIAALLLSVPALAADFEAKDKSCKLNALMADVIMQGRQAGVEMSEVVAVFTKQGLSKEYYPMVLAAYEHPRYTSEEIKRSTITEFKNSIYLQCMKLLKA